MKNARLPTFWFLSHLSPRPAFLLIVFPRLFVLSLLFSFLSLSLSFFLLHCFLRLCWSIPRARSFLVERDVVDGGKWRKLRKGWNEVLANKEIIRVLYFEFFSHRLNFLLTILPLSIRFHRVEWRMHRVSSELFLNFSNRAASKPEAEAER